MHQSSAFLPMTPCLSASSCRRQALFPGSRSGQSSCPKEKERYHSSSLSIEKRKPRQALSRLRGRHRGCPAGRKTVYTPRSHSEKGLPAKHETMWSASVGRCSPRAISLLTDDSTISRSRSTEGIRPIRFRHSDRLWPVRNVSGGGTC